MIITTWQQAGDESMKSLTNRLTIEKLNGHCAIQDQGRDHQQHLGFSGGGAADLYAFYSANKLLSNSLNCAALEVMMGQIQLKSNNTCTFAITGADCFAQINGLDIKHWQVHTLYKGDCLTLKQPKNNIYTYIAIAGGINSTPWLDSQSQTYTEQKLAFGHPALKVGSDIPVTHLATGSTIKSQQAGQTTNAQLPESFYQHPMLTLRFMPSPLWHKMTTQQQRFFLQQTFSISPNSNRMGYRLANKNPLTQLSKPMTVLESNKLSKPVCYGAIQLPAFNSPLILMKERQTIGGYPNIGTVMQTDLYRLSQMRPGEQVKFITTTIAQAQQQLTTFNARFQ